MGRPAEAAEHRKAIDAFARLVATYPDRPIFRSMLGRAWNNLGIALAAQERRDDAVNTVREAINHQRPLVDRLPQVAEFRQSLSESYENLAWLLRALKQSGAAAEATRERVKFWPKEPVQLYNGACEFALC